MQARNRTCSRGLENSNLIVIYAHNIFVVTKFLTFYFTTFNHYSAKARVISLNTQPTRPKAELAKIRRYHASLSAIIVL